MENYRGREHRRLGKQKGVHGKGSGGGETAVGTMKSPQGGEGMSREKKDGLGTDVGAGWPQSVGGRSSKESDTCRGLTTV